MEQKLFQKNNNIFKEKTYGPFTIEIPKHLSIPHTYKLAMYTLLNKHFHILSGEFISGIGYKLIKLNKNEFKYGKMGSLKLESYLLNKQRPITKHGVNTCVVDYVWDQVRGKHGFKTYTLKKEFMTLQVYIIKWLVWITILSIIAPLLINIWRNMTKFLAIKNCLNLITNQRINFFPILFIIY